MIVSTNVVTYTVKVQVSSKQAFQIPNLIDHFCRVCTL